MRILRRDWQGASELFQRVVNNEHSPIPVKVDSYLYLAIAAANSGADPMPWVHNAYDLNPYSRDVLQYLCIAELAKNQLKALSALLDTGKPLYAADDPWFRHLRDYLQQANTYGARSEQ